MVDTAEGVGGRKWSFENVNGVVYLKQGSFTLAALSDQLDPANERLVETPKVRTMLVTAPQLWAAANDLLVALAKSDDIVSASAPVQSALDRLENMVAKSVGKQAWEDVLQA